MKLWIDMGSLDLDVLQAYLGHADISTTRA
jgi:hypothetical protein